MLLLSACARPTITASSIITAAPAVVLTHSQPSPSSSPPVVTSGAGFGGTPRQAAPEELPPTPTASTGPLATATPQPAPTADAAAMGAQTPARNLVALATRLRPSANVTAIATAINVDHPVGYQTAFNVADQVNRRYFSIAATVRLKTLHAYFYVQDGLPYDAAGLQQAAQTFEARIYPVDTGIFGLPRRPGSDGDRRISIVSADIPGVGGYFSASDEYPPAIVPYSNQRNAIYINAGAESIGSSAYLSTIAHELQHMIHWNVRPHDDSWVNEGMSILAEHLNGYPVGAVVPLFLSAPDTQLDAWAATPQTAVAHYGAAYLFLEYFVEHYGGPGIMQELLASKAPDLQMFANFLGRHAPSTTLSDVFADWVVADDLNDPSLAHGLYAYTDTSLHAALTPPALTAGVPQQDSVHPYAARYYAIPAASATGTLQFQGATEVPLMQQPAHTGLEWWGNRADTMDTTLTRPIDLRSVTAAELDFLLWMDIEDSYDYFYVELSLDNGTTWLTLPGTHSTSADPNGQNYGSGYTGKSADGSAPPGWWQEKVDLSPYTGSLALLRFEYVTDEAYSGPGIGLDGISIPAIGFDDAVSGHSGWTPSGWLLTANTVPERFIVQAIIGGTAPAVYRMALDASNHGSLSLAAVAQPGQDVVVAVSALAPKTSEVGAFTLQISP